MDKLDYLGIIFILIISDLLISSVAVVKYGLYEVSFLHRWGFRSFGYSYALLGGLFAFILTFILTEGMGKIVEFISPTQTTYYFRFVYISLIVLYILIIILNALTIMWVKNA
jgi:hypothetical protein